MIAGLPQYAQWIAWAIVLVVSIRMDGLFCGLETGIYVMNKNRLDLHAESGLPAAKFLKQMLASPDRLLTTLLMGTNIVRYLSTFAISAMFVLAGYEHHAEVLTLAVAAPLLFVASDSVPKTVFQRLGAESVYRRVWLLKGASLLLQKTGLLGLVMAISRGLMALAGRTGDGKAAMGQGALAAMVADSHASGLLTHFQSVMADRVMRIREVSVADAMVPIGGAATIGRGADRRQMLDSIRAHEYSRLPVVDDDGRVFGILNVYDVLADEQAASPERKMQTPLSLRAELTVTDALYRMRRARVAMAAVERDGESIGIVTIKDLVEEIVGELEAW